MAGSGPVGAQTAITSGNLVILRVTDRTVATGQAVQLLEYAPDSAASVLTAVQTIVVPSTSGAANRFVISGSSTAGGILSVNGNNTVTFAGYRADVATTTLAATGVNRVIGSLDISSGTVNTNLNLAGSANTFRSAAVNSIGTTVYLSGANGIQFANTSVPTTPNATPVATASMIGGNTRQVSATNGSLYVSSGSATPGQQVFQVGTGQPTTGAQATTGLFGANQGGTNQYNSFAFARLGAGATLNGYDTVYAVDNDTTAGSTVQKFSYNGTSYIASGSVSLSGVNNIAVRVNASNSVDLFVTTATSTTGAGNSIVASLTDTSDFGGTLSGTFTTLLSNTGSEGFYGIAFSPVPEPATVGLLAAAGLGLAGFVRRRLVG